MKPISTLRLALRRRHQPAVFLSFTSSVLGNLFWLGFLTLLLVATTARADVLVLNTAGVGSEVLRFDGQGRPLGTFRHDTEAYYSMTALTGGEVWVASNILGEHTLQAFAADGRYRGDVARNQLLGLERGTRGPDGAIYALTREQETHLPADARSVLRIADGSTTRFVAAFTGGMTLPRDFVFGPDGNLYVADAAAGILRFRGDTGGALGVFIPLGRGGLRDPARITFGPDGRLYVASGATSSVLRFDGADGAWVDAFVPSGSGGLSDPAGMAFGPDGSFYVTSRGTNQVLRFDGLTGAWRGISAQALARPGDPRVRWGDVIVLETAMNSVRPPELPRAKALARR